MAKIPTRLEELLPIGAYEKVVDLLQRPDLSGRLREALNKVGLKDLNPLDQVQDAWQQAKTWLGSLAENGQAGSPHFINASGSLFPKGIDRAPMITSTSLSMARTLAAFQDRGEHVSRASDALQRLFQGRSFAWIAEPVAGLQIASRAIGKTALIARCDCARIPGFGDVRAMLAAFGNSVCEVGATNGATESDWTVALSSSNQPVVFLVSPSSLPRTHQAEHRAAAIRAAKNAQANVVELVVDGTVHDKLIQSMGFPSLPERLAVIDGVSAGIDLLLTPTNVLLGGSRGLLAVGDHDTVATIEAHASILGASMDSASISANVLALQLSSLDGEMECGVASSLTANPDNLKNRCQRLAIQLQGVGPIQTAEVIDSHHPLGGSPWDQYFLSNSVVAIQGPFDPLAIEQKLQAAAEDRPSIRVRQSENKLLIDLRFVHPDDDHHIAAAARAL